MSFGRYSFVVLTLTTLLFGCQVTDGQPTSSGPLDILRSKVAELNPLKSEKADETEGLATSGQQKTLEEIINKSEATNVPGDSFEKSVAMAVIADPLVVAAAREVDAISARVEALRASKDFQFNGAFYGGVEDVSDETSGVAMVLNANRILFDGGKIDSRIVAEERRLDAARHSLSARINERALKLAIAWVKLDRYEKLYAEIESRLLIIQPLMQQLQKVTSVGVGDITQVAAAQRVLSNTKVTQTEIFERRAEARLSYLSFFGDLPRQGSVSFDFLERALPASITNDMERSSPLLLAKYAEYLAAEADLAAVAARESYDLRFETKLSKPFGGSEFNSDESIGLVLNKNFYDGGQLDADKRAAEAQVESALAQIGSLYREGVRTVKSAQQTVSSMEKAIALARTNVKDTSDEISFLRKQLVIGGSSLDSVLAAEARLYEAESDAINFEASKYEAQFTLLSALGLLSKEIGINLSQIK